MRGAAEVGQLLHEACSGTEDLTLYISDAARATGRAVARAVSSVGGWCSASGQAHSCAYGEGSIEVVAQAEASAFADTVAELNACNCEIDASSFASSFQEVVVTAFAAALEPQFCSDGVLPARCACSVCATLDLFVP